MAAIHRLHARTSNPGLRAALCFAGRMIDAARSIAEDTFNGPFGGTGCPASTAA